jgi:hypothetical protein
LLTVFLVSKAPCTTEERENICCAAIQLGERYCGFAFSKGKDPAQVVLNTAGRRLSPTTTTRLLLRRGKETSVEMFGYDARDEYVKRFPKDKSSNYIYFDELMIEEKVCSF